MQHFLNTYLVNMPQSFEVNVCQNCEREFNFILSTGLCYDCLRALTAYKSSLKEEIEGKKYKTDDPLAAPFGYNQAIHDILKIID